MAIAPEAPKFIGSPIKRREDPKLIQGLAHYVDDIKLPDMLHMSVVRSPYGRATINGIDYSALIDMPDVVAVYTAGELAGKVGPVPVAGLVPDAKVPAQPVLAEKQVKFAGEPVAVVIAKSSYAASDAAALVDIDYSPEYAVVDLEKAIEPGSPKVHEEYDDNIAFNWELAGGDVEQGLAEADVIINQKIVNGRVAPLALETRGVVASYDVGEDKLTLWSSTQVPHKLRTHISEQIGLSENRMRVITPEVGGGFGSKLNVYREEALASHIARDLGQPIKWIESRSENFLATIHGRGQQGEVELGLKKDGRLTALRYTVLADCGAYYQYLTVAIFTLTGLMIPGPYKLPNVEMKVTGVFTNKIATDAYRGAGRPEATYILERIIDMAAAELGMDPVEIRRKNFPDKSEFPFSTASGLSYDSGDYAGALNKALKNADYEDMRRQQEAARKEGRYLGIGLSTYVEVCGMGPSAALGGQGWESARVRVEPGGKVTVFSGASPHGQGQKTSFAQIVADGLGIDVDNIEVIHGDTDVVPFGVGTFGSRGTVVGGSAVSIASDKVREKMARYAAMKLEADAGDIEFGGGKIFVRGTPEKSADFGDIAGMAYSAIELPPGTEPGLEETHFFEPPNFTFPFGAHVVLVEVDPETGSTKILRYVAVDDVGNQINPLLVAGQVHGGIAQGVGQALEEEILYDTGGQTINGSLMHYALPKAVLFPRFELDHTTTPTDVNPLGAKGVGEAGTIGSTPAVVNAVVDALSPFGVRHMDMPVKPERIWRVVAAKEA
ncbi:MAG: xanthine dehydrogenase family protein molybdopterin-binding subunit [Nitrospinaceae bacterium]|jgi:aerobic carbon-monoxide dehydrogenase large subunit|nr:xanthine dehydrogenase family protein molybdopterin-binding subunit [Nitrospinaceae bacterium]MBT3434882.1 xanthine dehydrogenase family protein molybdopterin-binding subunit [Nitrospinaceae bacterium]MBT6395888.1 xanthine dehydrogenase family protein molybdopterin-binding subunit [Nitrospinaceae bacterium]MBT7856148.1 xanthine dehydrogenase family protein molybdopterin-binding subunit [Nitrospinaceae bacterium]